MTIREIAVVLYIMAMGMDYADGIEDREEEIDHIEVELQFMQETSNDSLLHVIENIAMKNASLLTAENDKILKVVDEALSKYSADELSVDLEDGMLSVNICTRHSSCPYMSSVARWYMVNQKALEDALDNRDVGHCW